MKFMFVMKQINKCARFINTLILVATALINSMLVQAMVNVNEQITEYLPNTSSELVSFSALMFMILHPFVCLPANYILDNYSLKIGLSINCVMVIAGSLIRLFILHSFWWVIAGNFLIAIGNAFVLNCPAKYSAIWYPAKERLIITSMIVFASIISGGFGSFLSPFFVHDHETIEVGQEQLQKLVNFHAILVSSGMIINLLFFRMDPLSYSPFSLKIISQYPFSPSSQTNPSNQNIEQSQQKHKKQNIQKENYVSVLKRLLKDKNFYLPFISLMLSMAVLNNIVTNNQLYLKVFGYSNKIAGNATLVAIVAGLLGSVVSSIISIYKMYKKGILFMYFCSFISQLILSLLGLGLGITVMYWIGVVCFGFFSLPFISTIIQFTCQSMYPIGEATIGGILLTGGNIVSFLLGMANTKIMGGQNKQSYYICFGINMVFLITSFFVFSLTKQRLLRMQAQDKKNEINSHDSVSQGQKNEIKSSLLSH